MQDPILNLDAQKVNAMDFIIADVSLVSAAIQIILGIYFIKKYKETKLDFLLLYSLAFILMSLRRLIAIFIGTTAEAEFLERSPVTVFSDRALMPLIISLIIMFASIKLFRFIKKVTFRRTVEIPMPYEKIKKDLSIKC